jgi:hypothetical protein
MLATRALIEAEIVFLETGRKSPLTLSHPTARYRPHVSTLDPARGDEIRTAHRLGVEFPLQAREVRLGVPARYVFNPLFSDLDYSMLRSDVLFVVLEGDTVVGRGRVISVV